MNDAIECVKRRSRGKDYGPAISACKEAIEYNKSMEALKGGDGIPAGIGAVSLTGTSWESAEGRNKDLREVFRYVTNRNFEIECMYTGLMIIFSCCLPLETQTLSLY